MSSETYEIGDTTPKHKIISENGKKYYYIDVKEAAPVEEEVNLDPPEEIMPQLEESGPLHYYGENMVVKNSREMFNNVDILADGRYFCCLCNRPYKNHATLTAHLRGVHLRQECPCPEIDCNHISYTENERRKHQKVHDKQKYSRISRDSLRAQQKLDEKLISKHGYPTENAIHEQIDGRQVAGTITYVDRRGKTRYKCTSCHQSFQNTVNATRHIESHSDSPKECFYCGEIRSGSMDLHVHYMRFHRNEGVRSITCKACGGGFTTTTLFRNHATQEACRHACQNLLIRQDIYYGELPAGTTIDHLTEHRLNFFRKRQEERAAESSIPREKRVEERGVASEKRLDDEIFVGANALIQTEFGLKSIDEYRSSKAPKRGIEMMDRGGGEPKRIAQGYYEQQNEEVYQINYPPPAYGYDPLIGIYPDFQPMQQLQYHYYEPYEPEFYERQDQMKMDEGSMEPMINHQPDVIFDELDKLDFVMPSDNQTDDNVEDLEGIFNF